HVLHSFPTRRSSDLVAVLLETTSGDGGAVPVSRDARTTRLASSGQMAEPIDMDHCGTHAADDAGAARQRIGNARLVVQGLHDRGDRKSTRLNSSHVE